MKLADLLTESTNILNAKNTFVFKVPGASEKLGEISSVQDMLDWHFKHHPGEPTTIQWFKTVLFNAIVRGDIDDDENIPGGTYMPTHAAIETLVDMVVDMATEPGMLPPGENLQDDKYGSGYFYNLIVSSMPAWAQAAVKDGRGAFYSPYGELTVGPDVTPGQLSDYLNSRAGENLSRMSLQDALRLTVQWHDQRRKAEGQVKQGVDYKIVYTFKDGYSVWDLLTAHALDHESAAMTHCVGDGGYDKDLQSGKCKIYSFRDPKNVPVATMQVNGNEIIQIKGIRDKAVDQTAWSHVHKFIILNHLKVVHDHDNVGLRESYHRKKGF